MSNEKFHILIVEDDALHHHIIRSGLSKKYTFEGTLNLPDMWDKLEQSKFDLLLLDLKLDDSKDLIGLEAIKEIKDKYPNIPVIAITAHDHYRVGMQARNNGADDFFKKGEESYEFWDICMQKAIHVSRERVLALQNQLLKQELIKIKTEQEVELIGESWQIKKIRKDIKDLAENDIDLVLFVGEPGVGKEVAARFYHENSNRKHTIFHIPSLLALPNDVLYKEFHGYKKGSFEGAIENRKGRLAHGDGGIILLDNIDQLKNDSLKSMLHDFIRNKSVTPLGSDRNQPLDVLVITAASHKLIEKVYRDEKKFADNFFNELKRGELIEIPPLRERKEDIPLLLEYYLKRNGFSLENLTEEALVKLSNYEWKGNVGELVRAVETMTRNNDSETIDIENLPLEIRISIPRKHTEKPNLIKEVMNLFLENKFKESLDLLLKIMEQRKLPERMKSDIVGCIASYNDWERMVSMMQHSPEIIFLHKEKLNSKFIYVYNCVNNSLWRY